MTDLSKVGEVTHYYDKIGVGVVGLSAKMKVGDKIKVVRDDEEFEQEVKSMQVEHEQIDSADKGDTVGLKLDQPTKEGAEIFKLE